MYKQIHMMVVINVDDVIENETKYFLHRPDSFFW